MNRPENAREDFVNRADRHETPEQDSPETCTGETYTNVFVDLNDAGERPCGHDHTDPVAALECCLGRCGEQEWAITYRDDEDGRWQYLGEWVLVEPRVSA